RCVVVDPEHATSAQHRVARLLESRRPSGWQPYEEDRARALGVVRGDGPAVRFDEMADNGEAQTEAADRPRGQRFAPAERLEHVRQEFGIDARPGVIDADLEIGGA